MMCDLYGVTRAGFYAWCKRVREQTDLGLAQRVQEIHAESRGFYGSPRVRGQLRLEGVEVSRRHVARLMREAGVSRAPQARLVI